MPKGAGGQNGLDTFDIQVQELSVAGKELEKYTTNPRIVEIIKSFKLSFLVLKI